MKKGICLLLALLMLSLSVVTVSADTVEELLSAPVVRYVQTRETEDNLGQKTGTYDVRFLATVHSLEGDEVGFEVVANYINSGVKKVVYSKAEGDLGMAGSTVYQSVMAAGETVTLETVANGDATAVGMIAAVITGVPANESVIFDVTAYVLSGEDKISSELASAVYVNGEIKEWKTAYTQNFTAPSNDELLAQAGISQLSTCKVAATVKNGKLNVPSTAWNGGCPGLALIGRDAFATAPEKYLLEMDLIFGSFNVFSLILNGNTTDAIGVDKYSRANTPVISIRQAGKSVTTSAAGNKLPKFASGSVSNNNIWLRTMYFDSANKQQTPNDCDHLIKGLEDGATEFSMKLSIVVDSTPENGCRVEVYADGEYIYGYTYSGDAFDVTTNSYISLWAQDTAVSIDNLKLASLASYTSKTYPTESTAICLKEFNGGQDPVADCNVTRPYVAPAANCTGGLPLSIEDGQLKIGSHAWHTNPDYYAELIDSETLNAATTYRLSADITITKLKNFGFLFNNDIDNTLDPFKAFRKNWIFPSIVVNGGNLKFSVKEYNAAGGQATSKDITIKACSAVTADAPFTARFTAIVDSSDADGCLISLYLDGVQIGSLAYDNTKDVKASSFIGVWAEESEVSIDNLRLDVIETAAE